VKDIKYTNLRDDIPEQAFIPYLGSHWLSSMTVYLRTKADPNQLMPLVHAKVRELAPNLPIYSMRTMDVQLSNSLSTERMIASLSTVFSFLATLLAILGLYGVMAYSEIGIRMALGAAQRNVVWMVDARGLVADRDRSGRRCTCRVGVDAGGANPALRPDGA